MEEHLGQRRDLTSSWCWLSTVWQRQQARKNPYIISKERFVPPFHDVASTHLVLLLYCSTPALCAPSSSGRFSKKLQSVRICCTTDDPRRILGIACFLAGVDTCLSYALVGGSSQLRRLVAVTSRLRREDVDQCCAVPISWSLFLSFKPVVSRRDKLFQHAIASLPGMLESRAWYNTFMVGHRKLCTELLFTACQQLRDLRRHVGPLEDEVSDYQD